MKGWAAVKGQVIFFDDGEGKPVVVVVSGDFGWVCVVCFFGFFVEFDNGAKEVEEVPAVFVSFGFGK